MKEEYSELLRKLKESPEALEKGIDTKGELSLKECIEICLDKEEYSCDSDDKEWEYYYLDEKDGKEYMTGLFQLKRSDISESKPITETVSLGSINLDFRDDTIVGIEIFQDADKMIDLNTRMGEVEEPVSLEINTLSDNEKRFLNDLKKFRESKAEE